jgi:hypothetical protein
MKKTSSGRNYFECEKILKIMVNDLKKKELIH